jgi:hypothetical protein
MLLQSDLVIVPPECATQISYLNQRGVSYDLKTVICHHYEGLKWTGGRMYELRSVYALDTAIKAGLFGRASKSRYYVRVILGVNRVDRWYSFYVSPMDNLESRRINPLLIAILSDDGSDEVNGG